MTLVCLAGSRLVVFSAVALDADESAALESCGRAEFLVVPSNKHRLDAKTWKDRDPDIQAIALDSARGRPGHGRADRAGHLGGALF